MELDFDPDQEALRDSVRAFLDTECPIALVREVVEARIAGRSADAVADALDAKTAALGWPALTVPEAAGGLGLGPIELALVAEELGRALAPGRLFATITQYVPIVAALGTAEQAERLLAPVADGSVSATLAIAEPAGSVDPATTTVVARPTADGVVLHGSKASVVEPAPDGMVAVVARTPGTEGDDGVGVYVVPTDACVVRPVDAVDPSRVLATIDLDGVVVEPDHTLGIPGRESAAAVRHALDTATLGLALDAVGAAQALFDLSLDYVKQREQFGVPIGSFQSMKHKFADMLILVERARALAYFAALTIAEGDERQSLATAMAKAAAGDAATRVAKEGIQVHGGIGYTWEADVHLYVRRLESDALLFGSAAHHRRHVSDVLVGG
ncbi:MAG: acyl-CoA dehydrogenase family protein [Acidimicrobiia bacterium]